MIRRRALLVLPFAAPLAVPLALTACGNRLPGPAAMAGLDAGTHAMVLLRFVGTDQNGITRQPLESDWSHDPVGIGWGDFDSGGAPRLWVFNTSSEPAWAAGWVITVVPPGHYYLAVTRARSARSGAYEQAPRWRIEVPRGVKLLYAGTLALAETTEPGLFSRLWVGLDPARTTVRDETAAATILAARDLPALGPPLTRLMQMHTGPIRLGVPPG